MAVVECRLDKVTRGRQVDDDFEHYAKFLIDINDANMGDLSIMQGARATGTFQTPLPALYSTYALLGDTDTGSIARDFNLVRMEKNRLKLTCDVLWKKPDPGSPPGSQVNPPTSRPTITWPEFLDEEELVEKDRFGNPFVNAAEQQFDTPIFVRVQRLVIVVRKWYDDIQDIIDLHDTYEKTVNDDTYRDKPAGTWKWLRVSAGQPENFDGTDYWAGEHRIVFRKAGWDIGMLNRGTKFFKAPPGDKTLVPFIHDGFPAREPGLLAADGSRLADGVVGNFLDKEVLTPIDFDPLT